MPCGCESTAEGSNTAATAAESMSAQRAWTGSAGQPNMGRTGKRGSPVTAETHGASTRTAVYSGNRRVPGLYERTLADGSTVFDVALWRNGKVVRHRLEARTKTDAINEVRTLRVDYERGELHRSTQLSPTISELAHDYVAYLRDRIGDPSPKQRRSPRTVADAR